MVSVSVKAIVPDPDAIEISPLPVRKPREYPVPVPKRREPVGAVAPERPVPPREGKRYCSAASVLVPLQ
jgi:hypothetical protein